MGEFYTQLEKDENCIVSVQISFVSHNIFFILIRKNKMTYFIRIQIYSKINGHSKL